MNEELIATHLFNDPRVAAAKQLLLQTVEEHQKKITAPRPPIAALQESYCELLEKFSEYRGGKLWFPYLGSGFGNGALVELADGSIKYDFISGIGPHYLGHSNPQLISASIDAALSDTIMQGHLQQNMDSVHLCEILLKASHMDHCFLSTSGAMANENALKIAFQKRFPANRLLAFEKGFAGRTTTLSQITDKPSFREGLPSQIPVDYLPFYDPDHPEESIEKAVTLLKKWLVRYPRSYSAMIFELIQGEGGFYAGSKEFFSALMKILKEEEVTVIVDEIQTFGRTSSLFAFHHYQLEEYVDIVTIGKLSQVCATLFKQNHKPRPGLLSQTFTGSTSAIKASKVIVEHLLSSGYFGKDGKNQLIQNQFALRLGQIAERHPGYILGPFGVGSMVAFTALDGSSQRSLQFIHALFEAGVIGFTAGSHPTRVRFLVPAAAVTDKEIDHVCQIVETVLTKC